MVEIVAPTNLCREGRLDPAAAGWSRRPMHHCNVEARRAKRWDFWAVTDERIILSLCVADLGYLSLGAISILDVETGAKLDRVAPWRGGLALPDTVGGAPIAFDRFGVQMLLVPGRLEASTKRLRAEIEIAPPNESLNVVVPWDARRFWFTSKQIGLPARGRVEWGDRIINIGRGWAALDFGRGLWPGRAKWNWAAAAGPGVSFNLGGRWTDGTGATENGLVVGGVLHKIHQPVRFEKDGRIVSDEVELEFRPIAERRIGWPGRAGLLWHAGRFSGRVCNHEIDQLFGWSEALDISW